MPSWSFHPGKVHRLQFRERSSHGLHPNNHPNRQGRSYYTIVDIDRRETVGESRDSAESLDDVRPRKTTSWVESCSTIFPSESEIPSWLRPRRWPRWRCCGRWPSNVFVDETPCRGRLMAPLPRRSPTSALCFLRSKLFGTAMSPFLRLGGNGKRRADLHDDQQRV